MSKFARGFMFGLLQEYSFLLELVTNACDVRVSIAKEKSDSNQYEMFRYITPNLVTTILSKETYAIDASTVGLLDSR